MFCPRCSQEQISENTKFCSRCGFPLALVAELIAHDGILPQLAATEKTQSRRTRKNGLVFALFWFMLFSFILTPIFAIADVDELAAICAIIGTMGGLFITVLSFVYLKKEPKAADFLNQQLPNHQAANLYAARRNALPPQTQTAQSYVTPTLNWKAPDTGDLVQPSSVTEGTTKLLKNEE